MKLISTKKIDQLLKHQEELRARLLEDPEYFEKCHCTFAQLMVGDGCSVCNPDYTHNNSQE